MPCSHFPIPGERIRDGECEVDAWEQAGLPRDAALATVLERIDDEAYAARLLAAGGDVPAPPRFDPRLSCERPGCPLRGRPHTHTGPV